MQDSSCVIGVDLGATNVRAGLVHQSNLTRVVSAATPTTGTIEDVLRQIYSLIEDIDVSTPAGIGVGVPGLVDVDEGTARDVVNIPSWKEEVPIRSLLEERYSVPVHINNDANCFALGEYYFGKGRGHPSMIGLILGTGFAGGILVDGRLYAGFSGGAGEFGMIPYKDSVYEHYCAGLFFERQHGLNGEEVFRCASRGEQAALELFDELGHHLGMALKTVLYAYDPELIVFGGSVRKALPFFGEAMWEVLNTLAYPRTLKNLEIEVSELDHVAILGAAALVFDGANVSSQGET